MACCACGLRQRPRSPYCEQCGCPIGALAPPPSLRLRVGRPQQVPIIRPERLSAGQAATLGLLCAGLAWLPLYLGVGSCLLAVLLGSAAVGKARRRHGTLVAWLGWAVVLLGGACAIPALSGL